MSLALLQRTLHLSASQVNRKNTKQTFSSRAVALQSAVIQLFRSGDMSIILKIITQKRQKNCTQARNIIMPTQFRLLASAQTAC